MHRPAMRMDALLERLPRPLDRVRSIKLKLSLVLLGSGLVGAAYLVYLGVRTYRERGILAEAMRAEAPASLTPGGVYRQGVVVGLTNPKALVFFAALLPQFVRPGFGAVWAQMLVLGLGFVVLAMGLDCLWGLAAGVARNWFARSPGRVAAMGGIGGLTMIGLGVGLAVSGRAD